MRHRLPIIVLLAVLLTLVGASPTFASGGPHQAFPSPVHPNTPTCHGSGGPSGCDGKDPYLTGCAGNGASYGVILSANVTDSHGNYGGYVQLWWSKTCQTNWTRVVGQGNGMNELRVDLYTQDGRSQIDLCRVGIECPTINGFPYDITGQLYAPTVSANGFGYVFGVDNYSGKVCQYSC